MTERDIESINASRTMDRLWKIISCPKQFPGSVTIEAAHLFEEQLHNYITAIELADIDDKLYLDKIFMGVYHLGVSHDIPGQNLPLNRN